MKRIYLLAAIILTATLSLISQTSPAPKFTADGKLEFPADYREWIFLSSGLGMTYGQARPEGSPAFDNVFVHPDAYHEFLKTGHWPDHTVFVLEVRNSQSAGSINKAGNFQRGILGIQAAVKDVKRFTDGEWGYFGFADSKVPAGRIPHSGTCYTCHPANGGVENTFVQFYPTLLEVAKAKGTLKPGVLESLNK
jgi:Cytochrome P460